MSKIIEIIVSPKGETKLESKGFAGGSCQDATRAFEAALGKTTGESLTSEYYTEVEQEKTYTSN